MIDPNLICMNCMKELTHEGGTCPHCGVDNNSCANSALKALNAMSPTASRRGSRAVGRVAIGRTPV